MNIQTPILFIVFNRPDITQITFDAIKAVKPQKLYVAADGAREFVPTDVEKCAETRKIIEQVDWECDVKTLFQNQNLGVVKGVITAINWFFAEETEGVILEDDCKPNTTFFSYTSLLLEKYRFIEKVMHISGSNFIDTQLDKKQSYYFSNFGSCWGWATWRRAWLSYDFDMLERISDNEYESILKRISANEYHFQYFKYLLNYHRQGNDKIWDWRWTFSVWANNGIVINPVFNLVENIGYGQEATTSKGNNEARNKIANLKVYAWTEILHPQSITISKSLELKIQNIYNPPLTVFQKFKRLIPANIKAKIKTILFGKS